MENMDQEEFFKKWTQSLRTSITISTPRSNPTQRTNMTKQTMSVELDGCQVADLTLGEIQKLCFQLHPELKDLNPGSDYTEQYFDIQVSADSITVIFRKEQE